MRGGRRCKIPLCPSGRRGRGPRRSRGRVRWVHPQALWNPPPHLNPLRPALQTQGGRRGSCNVPPRIRRASVVKSFILTDTTGDLREKRMTLLVKIIDEKLLTL